MLDRTLSPNYYPPVFKNILFPLEGETESGIKTYTFFDDSQKVFKVELNFSVGSSVLTNPAIASICVAMLREGTVSKSARQISNTLDFYGASLDLRTGLENITISLFGYSKFFDKLVPLLADLVLNSTFNEVALQKHKKKAIQALSIDQSKTNYWSPRLLRQNIFGHQHPYSRLLSEQDFALITEKDLKEFHTKHLLSSLNFIIVAGAIPASKAEKILSHFNKIHYSTQQKNENYSPRGEEKKIIIKKFEDANQASISLGVDALKIDNKSYPDYSFATKVLGGYFGSRLMKNLREDKGFTYGVHAYNIHLKAGSYLQITADVELNSVNESIELIFKEISKLKTEAIPLDEISTVKNYMLGEFINDANTIFNFADLYKKLLIYSLPNNYYETFYQRILNLQDHNILDKLSTLWHKEDFTIVKVF